MGGNSYRGQDLERDRVLDHPDGKRNTSSGVPAGPDVALAVLASAAPIYPLRSSREASTAELVEVGITKTHRCRWRTSA